MDKNNQTPAIVSQETILEFLNERVAGQEEAKKIVATAGFLHLSKTLYRKKYGNEMLKLKNSNLLLMGPSGCGKTFLVKNLAEFCALPYIEINARAITQEGYKGNSISDYLETEYCNTNKGDMHRFPYSIVFIDEFDKICCNRGNVGEWDLGLQHSLLKVIEGSKVTFDNNHTTIDTSDMLFILGGNFESVRKNRENRKKNKMGFANTTVEEDEGQISHHSEIIKAGVIPEIAGRISLISEVTQLSRNDLRYAFSGSEDSILQQYQEVYKEIYGRDLVLSDYDIERILDKCEERKLGARSLQACLDEYLAENLTEICINADNFLDELSDLY